jgi:hypothetical protein
VSNFCFPGVYKCTNILYGTTHGSSIEVIHYKSLIQKLAFRYGTNLKFPPLVQSMFFFNFLTCVQVNKGYRSFCFNKMSNSFILSIWQDAIYSFKRVKTSFNRLFVCMDMLESPSDKIKLSGAFHFYTTYYTILKK